MPQFGLDPTVENAKTLQRSAIAGSPFRSGV
jgi:hypothetical protein